ncbi:amidohydrolase family protein [Streptomyces cinerochromogenes]|uniref:amidohydrolase family protein n=1 Tax=Streptomyces cinerochromogenes TaxID=66422 RepID=UPI0036CDDDAA
MRSNCANCKGNGHLSAGRHRRRHARHGDRLPSHPHLRALHRYAGLSPAQTLRTATAVPARMFGVEDDLGTAEPGKLADLTVIEGNPFQDFTDLTRVSWVMRDGIVHRREDVVGPHHPAAGRTVGDDEHWHAVGQIIPRESCCAT